tara:strand:+ start:1827 stop:2312 length:486 start_codon:yes stop_codon:yes gene_type:complete
MQVSPKKKKRQNKVITDWKDKFEKKLKKMHGNHWQNVFHRLMKKSSTLKTTLKRRSKEYEVEFDISLKQIRDEIHSSYGRKCKYCHYRLDIRNMVCDHIVPLSLGGNSTPENLQLICDRCNRRKGPLTDKQYGKLLKWLSSQSPIMADYILRKMSKADVMG